MIRPRIREIADALDPVDFAKRIARICSWLPLLWRDRDWDCAFLVRIMQFKLRRMADYIERHHHLMNWERDVRDMRVVAARFDRYLDSHKYGPPHPFPDSKFLEFEEIPGDKFRRLKQRSKRDQAMELRWARQHQTIENENWEAALEMIRKRGRGWWD